MARFIFVARKRFVWDGATYEPGDAIPEGLAANRHKLRQMWRNRYIDVEKLDEPEGQGEQGGEPPKDPPDPPPGEGQGVELGGQTYVLPSGWTAEEHGGHWYTLTSPDGTSTKVQGHAAVEALIEQIRQKE